MQRRQAESGSGWWVAAVRRSFGPTGAPPPPVSHAAGTPVSADPARAPAPAPEAVTPPSLQLRAVRSADIDAPPSSLRCTHRPGGIAPPVLTIDDTCAMSDFKREFGYGISAIQLDE